MSPDKLPGIDFNELKPCSHCGGPLTGKAGGPRHLDFYRVKVEHAVISPRAVQQFAGLTMVLGSEWLADVFTPDRHAAEVLDKYTAFLCFDCMPTELHVVAERRNQDGPARSQCGFCGAPDSPVIYHPGKRISMAMCKDCRERELIPEGP